ncbi:uncharacterized protein METZ01_LOCUS458279, partial [marine metagenome]
MIAEVLLISPCKAAPKQAKMDSLSNQSPVQLNLSVSPSPYPMHVLIQSFYLLARLRKVLASVLESFGTARTRLPDHRDLGQVGQPRPRGAVSITSSSSRKQGMVLGFVLFSAVTLFAQS